MEVEIISSEFIRPSSPTPEHLKTHKLSLLDQFIPSSYIPMVLFYEAERSPHAVSDNIASRRLQLLKQSLSEALTHFYPLAGRITKDNLSINCNDEGVHYIEAKVNYSLLEFLNQPNLSPFIHKFLPRYERWDAKEGAGVALIQVTCFACGGIAIGASLFHMIGDGTAVSFFLNNWGATARGPLHYALPDFGSLPSIFPQNEACPKDANLMAFCGRFLKKGRRVMRRFLFSAAAISELKALGSSSTVPTPTRVEAVSSLVCKCAAAAFKASSGLGRPVLASHSVSMRRRAAPAIPESYMGNFVWMVTAMMSTEELPYSVIKLREALNTINSDFAKSLEGEGGFERYGEALQKIVEAAASSDAVHGVDYVGFTSWCKFGLYDVDYGWGKPIWVTCSGSSDAEIVFVNVVLLMDTATGDGIEALIYLHEDDMAILQENEELLAFATLDPSPLELNRSG